MRKHKKTLPHRILSLVIAITMISSVFAGMMVSVSAEEEVFNSELLLNRLGIPAVYDEEAFITRGDFAMLAVEALKPGFLTEEEFFDDVSGEKGKYANTAALLGLVSKNDSRKFNPDDIITTEEAVTICIRILGYETIMLDRSYPTGYLNQAAKLGILDNLRLGQKLTGAEAALLIFRTLDTEYVEIQVNSNSDKDVYGISGNTYLEELFGVYKAEGEITSICGMRLNGAAAVDDSKIVIGGYSYANPYYASSENYIMLGRKVSYYARTNRLGEDEVIYIRNKSEVLEIDAKNVEGAVGFDRTDSSATRRSPYLNYYIEGRNDSEQANLSAAADVFINASAVVSLKNADFKPEVGKIYLTDRNNDGTYDVIAIEQYNIYKISNFNSASSLLVDEYGNVDIDLKKFKNTTVDIVTNDGKPANKEIIGENSILEVMASHKADGTIDYNKYARIKVASGKLTGTIRYSDGKYFYIDGNPYRVISYIKDELKSRIGTECTFYFVADDLIAAYDAGKVSEGAMTGFLMGISADDGLVKDFTFRIRTLADETIDVKPAKPLRYTGTYNGVYVTKRVLREEDYLSTIKVNEVVKYELDKENRLTLIQNAADFSGDPDYKGYDENVFSLDYKESNAVKYSIYLDGGYSLTDTTLCIFVKNGEVHFGHHTLFGTSIQGGQMKVYDANSSLTATYVVFIDTPEHALGGSGFFDNSSIWVVDDVSIIADKNGDMRTQIGAVRGLERKSFTAIKEDLEPINALYSNILAYGDELYKTGTTFSSLETGDVISVRLNNSGTVMYYALLYQHNDGNPKPANKTYGGRYNEIWTGDFWNVSGNVTTFYPGSNLRIDTVPEQRFILASPTYMEVRTDGNNIGVTYPSSINISKDDYVWLGVKFNRVNFIVKYVNE